MLWKDLWWTLCFLAAKNLDSNCLICVIKQSQWHSSVYWGGGEGENLEPFHLSVVDSDKYANEWNIIIEQFCEIIAIELHESMIVVD